MTGQRVTVEVPLAIGKALDYALLAGTNIAVGAVVEVPVGTRHYVAVVTAVQDEAVESLAALKPVQRVLCTQLPAAVVDLARFVADYYQVSLGMACGLITPPDAPPVPEPSGWQLTASGRQYCAEIPARNSAQRSLAALLQDAPISTAARAALSAGQRRLLADWCVSGHVESLYVASEHGLITPQLPTLSAEQRVASDALSATTGFGVHLLHGITGSGKTEVYLEKIVQTLNAGKQVLLLVPEINLTPQLLDRIRLALPGVACATLHSKLAAGERNQAWHDVASGRARLLVGTRLAVFAPLAELGLIVIDEEHDGSFKQNETPRYHARDVAIVRAQQAGIPVVLASATPSLESWRNARSGRYQLLRLRERASAAQPSTLRLVPGKGRRVRSGISELLAAGIESRLQRGEQSLVLVNRRGFAPALYCGECGWTAPCQRCDAKLTLHQSSYSLRCHHCGFHRAVPKSCPACGHAELIGAGVGTQKLEAALIELFPQARIARADTDSLSGKHAWRNLYEKILAREIDIVVGTQMLAKGHDFPALTLVGVVDSDRALFSTDFRAQEDMFALLTQVAGRAGRHALRGEVMIQTEFPEHPLFDYLLKGNYDGFADNALATRQLLGFPPFTRMALVRAESKDPQAVADFFRDAHQILRDALRVGEGEVFSPQPAPLARKADYTRWTMTALAPRPKALLQALAALREAMQVSKPKVRWLIDVDPYDFG